jgi:putative oxidoreductase
MSMTNSAAGARSASPAANLDLALLVGRVLIAMLFLAAGYLKATDFAGAAVGTVTRNGLPVPQVTAAVVVVIEIVLPLLLIIGFYARPAAIGLAVFTIAATFVAHRFWEFEGAAWFAQFFNFWKNIAVVGGLAILAATGPGRFAVRP